MDTLDLTAVAQRLRKVAPDLLAALTVPVFRDGGRTHVVNGSVALCQSGTPRSWTSSATITITSAPLAEAQMNADRCNACWDRSASTYTLVDSVQNDDFVDLVSLLVQEDRAPWFGEQLIAAAPRWRSENSALIESVINRTLVEFRDELPVSEEALLDKISLEVVKESRDEVDSCFDLEAIGKGFADPASVVIALTDELAYCDDRASYAIAAEQAVTTEYELALEEGLDQGLAPGTEVFDAVQRGVDAAWELVNVTRATTGEARLAAMTPMEVSGNQDALTGQVASRYGSVRQGRVLLQVPALVGLWLESCTRVPTGPTSSADVVETALSLWDPAGDGAYKEFPTALEAAAAL